MIFTCARKDLIEVLNVVINATSKSINPACVAFNISADDFATIKIQANNFEIGISTKIFANVESFGGIFINANHFRKIIQKVNGDTISFKTSDYSLNITSNNSKFVIPILGIEEFQNVDQLNGDNVKSFSFRASSLKCFIDSTTFAAANNDDRPIFTACNFKADNEKISMIATNTHRLAIYNFINHEQIPDFNLLIPAKKLSLLSKFINEDNNVQIAFNDSWISFTFDNFIFLIRLLSGDFPKVDKVININPTSKAEFETDDLLDVIDRVSIVANLEQYKTAKLNFTDNQIIVTSFAPDLNINVEDKIDAIIEGDPLTVSFNAKYIIDALKVCQRINGEKTIIEFTDDKLKPIRISNKNNPDFVYIVTPVRAD
ncbi:MAG: DNA polymerase III subunit beta [Selenomonadaceae bacterium]|nr:DNA polymerase III subunit beta [Selenomonadaceae bacterium]